MFCSAVPSSENQDRTTVPRARSIVLPPLQIIKTRPRSPEHILQFCPLFRESRHDHSPLSTFYSSSPSSENHDRTTVPRARSTVLPPLQRRQKAAMTPWSNAARTAVGQHGRPSEDHILQANHWTDHLMQSHARTQKKRRAWSFSSSTELQA